VTDEQRRLRTQTVSAPKQGYTGQRKFVSRPLPLGWIERALRGCEHARKDDRRAGVPVQPRRLRLS